MDDGFLQVHVLDEVHLLAIGLDNLHLAFFGEFGRIDGVIGKGFRFFVDMPHAGFFRAAVSIVRHLAAGHIFQHRLATLENLIG